MKSPDDYFDTTVHESGIVLQNTMSGQFYSHDGQFSVIRPERAQLFRPGQADIAVVKHTFDNVQATPIATVLDYLAATANAMGRPGTWLNARNGISAACAHLVLLTDPSLEATVALGSLADYMPTLDVELVHAIAGKEGQRGRRVLLGRWSEPTLAHVILRLSRWRDVDEVRKVIALATT